MNANETTPSPEKKAPAQLLCSVLVSGTIIGPAKYGKGQTVRLPEPEAKALEKLDPPLVKIVGV